MEHRLQTRPTPQARQQEATAARGGLILAVLLGSVYLSRAGGHPAGPAMSGTAAWLAALSLAGMPAALTMMRAVTRRPGNVQVAVNMTKHDLTK